MTAVMVFVINGRFIISFQHWQTRRRWMRWPLGFALFDSRNV